jgi:hypothetical protein
VIHDDVGDVDDHHNTVQGPKDGESAMTAWVWHG